MAKISASIQKQNYKVTIVTATGNSIIADEPKALGGQDIGFSPTELLASALAACTNATIKMYADRKEWDVEEVKMDIELEYHKSDNKTVIHRNIKIKGNINESQLNRILAIANACPVHKMLINPMEINTTIQ